jgi:tRNA threonylcarbamoyladenosine biosynthesis protein TsaE
VISARTSDASGTQALAAAVARVCVGDDLLVLIGDLGAGKTAFTQGFGREMGVTGPITSPTFTLANEYEGDIVIHHLDVYRIEQLDEVRDLALPELLDGGAVTLIEWGDAILPALPKDFLEVRLTYGEGDDDRLIELRATGPRWMARAAALAEATQEWSVGPC